MRITIIIISILTFVCCKTQSGKSSVDKNVRDTLKVDSKIISDSVQNNLESSAVIDSCDISYDTISVEKYEFHVFILEVFNDRAHRNYLNDQDIAMFMMSLDPDENRVYNRLTNKVIFALLQNVPDQLTAGLYVWPAKANQFEYFYQHLSHPRCNNIPIEKIKSIVKDSMPVFNEHTEGLKQRILDSLP